MTQLLIIGVVIGAGIALGRSMKPLRLPAVTGYVLAGVLIGLFFKPSSETELILSTVSSSALAFIAYTMGTSLNLRELKKMGGGVIIVAFTQAFGATLVTILTLTGLLGQPLELTLILGAIASTTAPAATLMIVRQYRANGPFTRTLLPVVALDDAIAIIIFGFSQIAVASMVSGKAIAAGLFLEPLATLGISAAIGFAGGLLLSYLARKATDEDSLLAITLGVLFVTVGITEYFGYSALLAGMVLGTVVTNLSSRNMAILNGIDRISYSLMIIFFVFAGMGLNLELLPRLGLVGLAYVVARSAGKIFGAWIGGVSTRREPAVRKYLGLALLPQAGVALGLAASFDAGSPELAEKVRTIIVSAVIVFELIGPPLAKIALKLSGDIKEN